MDKNKILIFIGIMMAISALFFISIFTYYMHINFNEIEKSLNQIDKCEIDYIGCDVYKCKAENSVLYNLKRNYLLQEQNCLIKNENQGFEPRIP